MQQINSESQFEIPKSVRKINWTINLAINTKFNELYLPLPKCDNICTL